MSVVQQEATLALYVCYAAHRLNLAVFSACNIQSFKNPEWYVCVCVCGGGGNARFFHPSVKLQRALDKAIKLIATESKAKNLKDACRTRWVYGINLYVAFLELLAIVHPSMHQELDTAWMVSLSQKQTGS